MKKSIFLFDFYAKLDCCFFIILALHVVAATACDRFCIFSLRSRRKIKAKSNTRRKKNDYWQSVCEWAWLWIVLSRVHKFVLCFIRLPPKCCNEIHVNWSSQSSLLFYFNAFAPLLFSKVYYCSICAHSYAIESITYRFDNHINYTHQTKLKHTHTSSLVRNEYVKCVKLYLLGNCTYTVLTSRFRFIQPFNPCFIIFLHKFFFKWRAHVNDDENYKRDGNEKKTRIAYLLYVHNIECIEWVAAISLKLQFIYCWNWCDSKEELRIHHWLQPHRCQ